MNKIFKIRKNFSQKIKFEYLNGNCRAILNHDKALNALDEEMIDLLKNEIDSWEN